VPLCCPDNSETLSGCFRNGCPYAAEILTMIIEKNLTGESRILRTEARHRLKEGKGIRVFSRPDKLKSWLEDEGLKLDDRKHLITDAGKLIPGYDKSNGIEIFAHSPFAAYVDGELVDRNGSSLILHATFYCDEQKTKFILIGDTTHEVLTEIVNITKAHKNECRLEWDIFDVPHHCSYMALNSEKGKDKTDPVEDVKWLFDQGKTGGIIVSCSKTIPNNDDDDQPPHRQAANFYKDVATNILGEFVVTMEYPKSSDPAPLIITIEESGATLKKKICGAGVIMTSRQAPRAGVHNVR